MSRRSYLGNGSHDELLRIDRVVSEYGIVYASPRSSTNLM